MAEETQTKQAEAGPAQAKAEEVVVTESNPAEPEKPAVDEPAPVTEAEKPTEEEEKVAAGEEAAEAAGIAQSVSFKEESNLVADLEEPQKKALDELKQLIQAALANNEFVPPPPPPAVATAAAATEEPPKPTEEPKAEEEVKPEEPSEQSKTEETTKPVEEEVKSEEPPKPSQEPKPEEPTKLVEEEVKPEEPAKPSEEPTTVEAEEKAVVVDDGVKTVEAIEETVVQSAAPAEEPTPAPPVAPEETPTAPPEEVFIWGVPLLGDEKSDTILIKFLRARDFKVKDALTMIKNAVIWRKIFGIEALLEEDLGLPEMNKVVFMHGADKEAHPVCYNVYGEFIDKELYAKAFGDEEKRQRFLRWRIQLLEKGIREQLDFTPGGVCTMVQVTDLTNSPGAKRELRQVTKQALAILQDNYPEFVAKQVFINVPWWYLAFHMMISPFLTQRTKSKFVFSGPAKSAETLFKYISPEQVPVQYGGLSKENDPHFTAADAVTDITIKPSTKQTIEIPVTEACFLVWEFRVLGWEVTYGAEFVPSTEDGYTVIVQKSRKLLSTDEPIVKNGFKIGEPGKIVLTIDNTTSKKKKLLYRSKSNSATEAI